MTTDDTVSDYEKGPRVADYGKRDDTVTAKLAEWEALVEGGTEGEWRADSATGQVWATPGEPCLVATAGWVEDAAFIAHARTAMPALLGFVEDVLAACEKVKANPAEAGSVTLLAAVIEQALTERIGGEG